MQYRVLGKTGLLVSRLCFGTLTMGPLQANLSLEEGAALLSEAFAAGVNFWDTAESYRNYQYLRLALKKTGALPVIASRTYAYSADGAKASLEKARRELDLDVIPIFMLHEQESALTLAGHRPALAYLCEARERGLIKAVGISCHTVAAVRAAIHFPELDVIHPLINYQGIGIKDGTAAEMLAAMRSAFKQGLGIYGMKVLGGGHLGGSAEKALTFARRLDCLDAMAVGMASRDELIVNLCYLQGDKPPLDAVTRLARIKRRLKVEDWCSGCGSCIKACPQGALSVVEKKKRRAVVDRERCILCGYCGAACLEMCLKIF
ncbi:MAG: aldo/keto reductase [Bacillota bacterium]